MFAMEPFRLHRRIQRRPCNEWDKMDPNVLNQKLKVLWIGSGREDNTLSFSSIQSFADSLTQKNVKHVFNPSGGGHSWPNWQVYLSKYAPLLFQ